MGALPRGMHLPPRVCALFHKLEYHGAATASNGAGGCREAALLVKGLVGKEMSWPEPLLELTKGGVGRP